jgi:peptidoglycan/LPS O-acetylase OafA/YrhL
MATMHGTEAAIGTAQPEPVRLRYRPEIDGLRALSVILVVLFHAGCALTPAGFVGVDVFYVISGYLITGLLARELRSTGHIRLIDFWGRRMRRILPAAVLVLVASFAVANLVLPASERLRTLTDLQSAALYALNWELAHRATDYFNTDTSPSLYLHYWSLSIEEQFYAGWPLIILGVVALRRRLGRALRVDRLIARTAIVVCLGSFAYSLYLIRQDQPLAFFSTFSRAWELGLGGLAAVLPLPPFSQVLRRALTWCGLAAILAAAIFYSGRTPYPGIAATLPVAGALCIVVVGRAEAIGGWVGRAMSAPVPVLLGKLSYAWYLWHWPVLLLGRTAFGDHGPIFTAALILLSLLLAGLTYRFVERPIRFAPALKRSPAASIGLGAALTLSAAGFAALAQTTFDRPVIVLSGGQHLSLKAIYKDRAAIYDNHCHLGFYDTAYKPCVFGDASAARTVVLFGDSHAATWFPALDKAAKQRKWRLLVRTKSACAPMIMHQWNGQLGRNYTECWAWRQAVLGELARIDPDLIVVTGWSDPAAVDANTGERLRGEADERARKTDEENLVRRLLETTTSKLVLIRDVPGLPVDPIACLLNHPGDETACASPLKRDLGSSKFPRGDYSGDPRVSILDFNDQICESGICQPARDGHVLMRDPTHLTASFAATFAPDFSALLVPSRRP